MVKFFTNPTGLRVRLKYIVVNPVTEGLHIRYIVGNRDWIREILIDTGVDYLFNMIGYRDYPRWWINKYIMFIRRIEQLVQGTDIKLFATIPDIPADYRGREKLYPWNVHRTIEYIQYFMHNIIPLFNNIEWIAPIQGRRDDILSVVRTYTENIDLYKNFRYVAIAPTCTTRKYRLLSELILRMDNVIRYYNIDQKYHVFGPSLKTIRIVYGKAVNMYSFDSTAYYFFNDKKTSSPQERTLALLHYCRKLKEIGIDHGVINCE